MENNTVEEMTDKVLIPYVTDYIVFQKDSKHLMIETYNSDYDFGIYERKEYMFQAIQETSDKPAKLPEHKKELKNVQTLEDFSVMLNNTPRITQEDYYANTFF